ncbi:MAG: polysaccharide deacetylase family protein [Thermodesulfobacteriota bacterium]
MSRILTVLLALISALAFSAIPLSCAAVPPAASESDAPAAAPPAASPEEASDGAGAVIFMYHRFGEDRYPSTSVRLAQFDAQLDYLAKGGFVVWPLEKIVEHLAESRPIPDRTVAITIDDAYRSVYTEAYPRLKERGWPFTVFVSTGPVDRHFNSIMSWDQLREMSENGATIANHGVTHSSLAGPGAGETKDEWLGRAKREILDAEKRITEETGPAPKLFAYPYGEYSRDLAILVAELGYVGFGQQSGPVGPYSDSRSFSRFPVAEAYADLKDFALKAESLPLPVRSVRPWDPVLPAGERRPLLELGLAETGAGVIGRVSCFVSGQGRVEVEWTDRGKGLFTVRAPEPLGTGRARYNCTAPSGRDGRFFWYSHIWIVGRE